MLSLKNLEKIHDRLEKIEEDIRETQAIDASQEQRTSRFIHILIFIIAMVALTNLYFVGDLAQQVQILMRNMTKTYVHFGEMTDRMHWMTHHVKQMDDSISLMPVVVDQLWAMSEDMHIMDQQVHGISTLMNNMTRNVYFVNHDITQMSSIFRDVNGKLVHIRQNVRQMANVVP